MQVRSCMRVSVVGLGKLGTPLAAVLADHGHDVTGVDVRADAVETLNAGRAPVDETGLADLVSRHASRLHATTDVAAVAATEATFVIVPTPSLPSGRFSNQLVVDAMAAIGEALRGGAAYHVVAVTSTVVPMSMDREIRPALERASGRKVGESLGLCYNPLFIALGSVIHNLTHPDLVLIGESDPKAGDVVEGLHRTFIAERSQVRRMSWINAEITKLAVNIFVTTKISYANMLAELCERLPGADVDVVTGAVGMDRRVGSSYLTGAVGYGGPCFPRDNAAFAAVATDVGTNADLARATDATNRHQLSRLVRLAHAHLTPTANRVGVLGLAYKPDTDVTDDSPGLMLANRLATEGGGVTVTVYDPAANHSAGARLDRSIAVAPSTAACLDASDVVIVTVPWPEFRGIPQLLASRQRRRLVILDCWRLLDRTSLDGRAQLVHVGRSPVA
jgi:UDPglucose 6-dehydrogenase